ncbi:MAG TPA: ABC transporter ATP-binding protein [Opitutaceae bacterium]|nr:ABC transporter ATP-binding protein [Opitutaceae bacterium]
MSNAPLLELDALSVEFPARDGGAATRVVDAVSFAMGQGGTLALVGESGAGKSITGLAIMRLVPWPGWITGGAVRWKGEDVAAYSKRRLREFRGAEVAMIFQEPSAMMNPVYPIGDQVAEVIRVHRGLSARDARHEALAMLERVRIADAAKRYGDYPHQMSGGMLQRVMIAQAMACRPVLLIADEPTTALDAAVQREILELLDELQAESGMALLLITHNLGLVAEMADSVVVMKDGRVAETAAVGDLFARPASEYTRSLLAAMPGGGE